MAKFTIEVDTDTKNVSFLINGESSNVKEFSISQYQSMGYCEDASKSEDQTCTYLSVTNTNPDGSKSSYGLSWDTSGNHSESYSINNYSISKEIAKIHEDVKIASNISKLVGTRKPIKTFDISTWENGKIENLKEPDFMK